MISIVCVYNSSEIFENVLSKSLNNQTVLFELIALDNQNYLFKSAAEALNYGGLLASGKYIMFAHQDMWLGEETFLEQAENALEHLSELGVAGVAGIGVEGARWIDRIRYSMDIYNQAFHNKDPVTTPQEVQTLDECLLIVPRAVFSELKFDEKTFDGWDCYGADYCLCAKQKGLKTYVIPGRSSHCTTRGNFRLWEFKDLLNFQKRLYRKHKKHHRTIHTWVGKLNPKMLVIREILQWIGPIHSKLFPSFPAILKKELGDCNSVIDLECGPFSPLYLSDNMHFKVGIERSETFIRESKRLNIHHDYILGDFRHIDFKKKSLDAVVSLYNRKDLSENEHEKLINKMKTWAKKRVIITGESSAEFCRELKSYGFRVYGIDGWIGINNENSFLKERFAEISQKITFYHPEYAKSLMGILEL